jgi:hypothetical protein
VRTPSSGARRRGEGLVDHHATGGRVEQDDVGERAADVDGETPVGGHDAISWVSADPVVSAVSGRELDGSRRREHVEDPHLVVLVVADEDALAVPDGGRGEVEVAGAQLVARAVVGVADAEVERAAHDDAELLLDVVAVQERAGGAALDAPEPELEVLADDHAAAEAGAVGLLERVVVEEVDVDWGSVVGSACHSSTLHHAALDVVEVRDHGGVRLSRVALRRRPRRSPGGRRTTRR